MPPVQYKADKSGEATERTKDTKEKRWTKRDTLLVRVKEAEREDVGVGRARCP